VQPPQTQAQTPVRRCPQGYLYDESNNICVPPPPPKVAGVAGALVPRSRFYHPRFINSWPSAQLCYYYPPVMSTRLANPTVATRLANPTVAPRFGGTSAKNQFPQYYEMTRFVGVEKQKAKAKVKRIGGAQPMTAHCDFLNPEIQCILNPEVKSKKYEIHDNGGRPFRVTLSDSKEAIIEVSNEEDDDVRTWVPSFAVKYTKAWIGFGSVYKTEMEGKDRGEWSRGNSILLENVYDFNAFSAKKINKSLTLPKENGGTVLWIGWSIELIHLPPKESVVQFVSVVGNNDVPYPYFSTQKRSYLLVENVSIDNRKIPKQILQKPQYTGKDDIWRDLYVWYYDWENTGYSPQKDTKLGVSHFKSVTVYPRI
jgi:hypothetical protein